MSTALRVGTMNFGKRTPGEESVRIVHRALERGLRFFDTANAYNDGESERILGRALKGRREACTIGATMRRRRFHRSPSLIKSPSPSSGDSAWRICGVLRWNFHAAR